MNIKPENKLTIKKILEVSPFEDLEHYLNDLRDRVDDSIIKTNNLRIKYRKELLQGNPDLEEGIKRPSKEALEWARGLLVSGTVAASDGTISTVSLLGGSKIQVGVVIVFNKGEVVDYVTKIFEREITEDTGKAVDYFKKLKKTRNISNLLSRAVMLYSERQLLLEHEADWRMIHGELLPHELRTGAGNPKDNLPLAFKLVHDYINTKSFVAVTEGSNDIDILNAAILLEPGEYFVLKTLTDVLNLFLNGDKDTGQSKANFTKKDERKFRDFISQVGDNISIVMVKAGDKPFLLECHSEYIEKAVALFLADSLWTRGFPLDGSAFTVRGFPYHIDLADQVARTLLKGSDFQNFIERRLFDLSVESGIFDIDPRKTRI